MLELFRYVVELIIAFSVLILPFIWAKEYLWAVFFGVVGLTLITFEIIGCLTTCDISLSNRIWVLDATNPIASIHIFWGMIVFWLFLILHLMYRI